MFISMPIIITAATIVSYYVAGKGLSPRATLVYTLPVHCVPRSQGSVSALTNPPTSRLPPPETAQQVWWLEESSSYGPKQTSQQCHPPILFLPLLGLRTTSLDRPPTSSTSQHLKPRLSPRVSLPLPSRAFPAQTPPVPAPRRGSRSGPGRLPAAPSIPRLARHVTVPAPHEPGNCHPPGGARGASARRPLAARRRPRGSVAASAPAIRTAWASAPGSSGEVRGGRPAEAAGELLPPASPRGPRPGAGGGPGEGRGRLLLGTWGASRGDRPCRRRSVPAKAEHLALAGPGGGALRPLAAPRSRTPLAPGSSAARRESCALVSPPGKRPGGEGGSPRLPSALRLCDSVSEVQEGAADSWDGKSPHLGMQERMSEPGIC